MSRGSVEMSEAHTDFERVQALCQVMSTLNQTLSMRATVKTVLSIALDHTRASAAAVYLVSHEGEYLIVYDSQGLQDSNGGPIELASSAPGRVLASGTAQGIVDTAAAPDLRLPNMLDGSLPRSFYGIPISTHQGPIGALITYSEHTGPLEPGAETLLAALAASIGVALTNARLMEAQAQARQQAERYGRAVTEYTARLHTLLGATTDGVWICNQNGVIVAVNDAGIRMFGLRRADVVDQPVAVLAHLFDVGRGERRRLGLRLALQGETMHVECDVVLQRSGDELTVDIRSTPIRDDCGAVIGAVAVVRDLTEAKMMDRLKEDFLSVAAHELKTPITALKGYTQLALKRTPPISETHSTRRALTTIDEQADRITRLVQKLLDVSRIQSGRLELHHAEFDIQELLAGIAERARASAPAHVIDVEPNAPLMITADYERLEQVLMNLVDNALKYSARGDTIQLAARTMSNEVRISVHDQGVGIPEDKLPHIFDRWYQAHFATHGDFGGMGLGLYICKEIIEQHGGHMWATSSEAEGTTIGCALPRSQTTPERS